jgi:hypothetical protein
MRKSFQTDWQGIHFSDIARTSSRKLAGPEFYQAFYEEFFKRYLNWDQLPTDWRRDKELCAEFILARGGSRRRILSIGCGLGIMEHHLRARAPGLELYIHEVAPAAWRWIGPEFPKDRKILGRIPECLPVGLRFDVIYLSTVDYAFSDKELTALLASLRPFLSGENAECLLISGNFQETPSTPAQTLLAAARRAKSFAAAALDALGLRARGQFWGWARTREEYGALLLSAGFNDVQDGFVDVGNDRRYWISGR